MITFLKQTLQLLLAPTKGWEDVASNSPDARRSLIHGLLPIIAVAAISVFARAIWEHQSFLMLLLSVHTTFAQYFLTYYVALLAMVTALPYITISGDTPDENRIAVFLCYSVSMMACIAVIDNFLPMELTLVQFLPIYVAVVMAQGRIFLSIDPESMGKYVGLTVGSVIVPVYLIEYLLDKITL